MPGKQLRPRYKKGAQPSAHVCDVSRQQDWIKDINTPLRVIDAKACRKDMNPSLERKKATGMQHMNSHEAIN